MGTLDEAADVDRPRVVFGDPPSHSGACVGGRESGSKGEAEHGVIALGANDWVILRRPAAKKVPGSWAAVGVVANELLAKAIEAAAGALYPGSELRALSRDAFARELR